MLRPGPESLPVITTQPASQTVAAGELATFTAASSGNPTPSVQWQVYEGGAWENITDATSTSYAFTALLSWNGLGLTSFLVTG
jgi:Immunoglobulin I-set domain